MTDRLVFFLGGRDLEMVTIRELLEREAPGRFHDAALGWGAKASAYRGEIEAVLACGDTPVLIELDDDLGVESRGARILTHHGTRAGVEAPTSLQQVFAALGLPKERWTHWFELVSANDRGYIPELAAVGAAPEEIARVRTADRAAQGITPQEEAEGARALAAARRLCVGRLIVVTMGHGRIAVVEDRLHRESGGPAVQNLLVLSPGQLDFSGDGGAVMALNRRYPGGWYGGALPGRGFWGLKGEAPGVVAYLENLFSTGPGE